VELEWSSQRWEKALFGSKEEQKAEFPAVLTDTEEGRPTIRQMKALEKIARRSEYRLRSRNVKPE